jgi:hypothetical protein
MGLFYSSVKRNPKLVRSFIFKQTSKPVTLVTDKPTALFRS